MSRKVLVLNADYSALSICTVPKAFLLVYLDKAELVTDSPKGMLRTVDKSYPLPSVIRLHHYVSLPFKGVMLSRQNVFRRDGNKCIYCGSHDDLTLDHVLPKSRGGANTEENLSTVPVYLHEAYNALFGSNPTPDEVALILTSVWIDPRYEIIVRLKQTD